MGLLFVTDGEFRRRWWHLDWLKEFDGFDTIHFTKEINGTSNEIGTWNSYRKDFL